MIDHQIKAAGKISGSLEIMKAQLRPLDLHSLQIPTDNEKECLDYYGLLLAPEEGKQSVGFFESDQERLACYRFQPKNPVRGSCFVMHGYYDHVGIYSHVVKYLVQQGLEVIAFDLPGHGLSTGPRASIHDFAQYRSALELLISSFEETQLPRPWYAVGQSTGAGILADYLLTHELDEKNCPFVQTAFLAPLLRPRRWPMAKLAYYAVRPFSKALKRSYSRNSSDWKFLDFVRFYDPLQPRTLPLAWVGALMRWIPRMLKARPSSLAPLIVQGEMDTTVDWRFNNQAYAKLFPNRKLFLLPKAGHHLANEAAAYRKQYMDWIIQNFKIEQAPVRKITEQEISKKESETR